MRAPQNKISLQDSTGPEPQRGLWKKRRGWGRRLQPKHAACTRAPEPGLQALPGHTCPSLQPPPLPTHSPHILQPQGGVRSPPPAKPTAPVPAHLEPHLSDLDVLSVKEPTSPTCGKGQVTETGPGTKEGKFCAPFSIIRPEGEPSGWGGCGSGEPCNFTPMPHTHKLRTQPMPSKSYST